MRFTNILIAVASFPLGSAFVPLIDGGKSMPKLYDGWFNDQIAKQASTAIAKALSAGKRKIEVNFPPVPNVDEVKFGTPANQKFGREVLAKDLKVTGGYKPGAARGGALGGKPVCVLSNEQLEFRTIKSMGDLSRSGRILSDKARQAGRNGEVVICVNPGGEAQWEKFASAHGSPGAPFVILNSSYSTTYDLGNKCDFEEAYYLKRISKGWVFRSFPGPWEAYLERPDGSTELLKSWKIKPSLKEAATLVREESFKRYSINNDRYSPGFGERL
eukprot:scaffold52641_cov48-Attheya_sp.AAC.3